MSRFREMELPPIDPDAFRAKYGPWAVVSGASDGTGAEFASQIAALGVNVVIAARRGELLEELGSRLAAEHGVEYRTVVVDLKEPDAAQRMLDATEDLDVGLYVSNAGVAHRHDTFLNAGLEAMRGAIAMNVTTLAEALYGFGARFKERGRGGIIVMTSGSAFNGSAYLAMYGATKAFGQVLAEALHLELGPYGVDVLGCLAGSMLTETALAGRGGVLPPPGQHFSSHDSAAAALGTLGVKPVMIFGEEQQEQVARRIEGIERSRASSRALAAAWHIEELPATV